jgi:hypothetical protein
MAELNPLGSEKLQGDDKLKRILELTYYGNKSKSPSSKAEFISESTNGVYGIVREKDGYFVKKGLNESSLDYIGGLFMKNKNRFSSYAEALKRLELLNGQENLQEATKYVLKQNKPMETAPMTPEVPLEPQSDEMPVTAIDDLDGQTPSTEELPSDEMGDDSTSKPSDYMSEVQKFAGKLGQELRDQKEKMESDDIKYVLNMIISAVNLNKLDEEDIEDISKKFERNEEDMMGDEEDMMGDEDETPSEEPEIPSEEPESDEDLGEMSMMDKLETFINMPAVQDEEIDLSKYADLGSVEEDDIKEVDLEEIKKEINRNIEETLGKYFK